MTAGVRSATAKRTLENTGTALRVINRYSPEPCFRGNPRLRLTRVARLRYSISKQSRTFKSSVLVAKARPLDRVRLSYALMGVKPLSPTKMWRTPLILIRYRRLLRCKKSTTSAHDYSAPRKKTIISGGARMSRSRTSHTSSRLSVWPSLAGSLMQNQTSRGRAA